MLTKQEYTKLRRKIDAYELARDRLFRGRRCFTPGMVATILEAAGLRVAPTNEERSQIEVFEFVADPPEKYFAYVQEDTREVTTWMGDVLGKIVYYGKGYCGLNRSFRLPIKVKAINGWHYHGTYYKSSGDYCRLKRCK